MLCKFTLRIYSVSLNKYLFSVFLFREEYEIKQRENPKSLIKFLSPSQIDQKLQLGKT